MGFATVSHHLKVMHQFTRPHQRSSLVGSSESKRKKQNAHPFIVASFNAQSVKGNDMDFSRCDISTLIKANGVEHFIVTETWHSAQGDEEKNVELAPSGFDMKSIQRHSRSRDGGISTTYKYIFGSSITFKTCFDFIHTSIEVELATITMQHNTLYFFCLYRPLPNRRNNLTDTIFTEQMSNLLYYINNLPGLVFLVGEMNIHFDNELQSLTLQTMTTFGLYNNVQIINNSTHMSGHMIDWVVV